MDIVNVFSTDHMDILIFQKYSKRLQTHGHIFYITDESYQNPA
jgi:hypothetical protein